MRTIGATFSRSEGRDVLVLAEDVAVTSVLAIKGVGLYAATTGEPVKLACEPPIDWTILRDAASVVVGTTGGAVAVPLAHAVRSDDPEAGTSREISRPQVEDLADSIRRLGSQIPRKRPLRMP